MRVLVSTLVVACILAGASCGDRETVSPTGAPSTSTPRAGLTLGKATAAVYRNKYGVGAEVRNTTTSGVRDVALSIRFSSGDALVNTVTDVLAFCPAQTSCPWAVSFTITDDRQRTIDSADVTISRVGGSFDDGVVRSIDLRLDSDAVSFDLPPRVGVAVLYAERDDGPYFGVFTTNESSAQKTVRLTEDDLPIGPQTRGVFYEGYIPEAMRARGH